MKVLVINCGSSSLKYQVLDMDNEELLAKGLVERIGIDGSVIKHEREDGKGFKLQTPMATHKEAIENVFDALLNKESGVLQSMDEIGAVGHRVVHAGEKLTDSTLITDDVIKILEECFDIAPSHNPPNVLGIKACQALMPNTPMVAVFDTAFHSTMPASSYIYAIPYEYYEKYGIRRYGFHGTSHKYVSERAAKMLNIDIKDLKIITCHLGNGASVSAIKSGKCIDTSMGFTPLEGVVMGTRSGGIDPAIIEYIMEKEGLSIEEMLKMLNRKSGVFGISGVSSDFRDLEVAANEGNERAQLALDIFAQKIKGYIGSYLAELDGADVIVFTAGIGENAIGMRAKICSNMENLGIKLDPERNNVRGEETIISAADSKIKILLIPTNEELMIARDTVSVVSAQA